MTKSSNIPQMNDATLEQVKRAQSLMATFYFHSSAARDIADRLMERADREGRFEEMVEKIAFHLTRAHDIPEEHEHGIALAKVFDDKCGTSQTLRKASLRDGIIYEDNTLEHDDDFEAGFKSDEPQLAQPTFKPTIN